MLLQEGRLFYHWVRFHGRDTVYDTWSSSRHLTVLHLSLLVSPWFLHWLAFCRYIWHKFACQMGFFCGWYNKKKWDFSPVWLFNLKIIFASLFDSRQCGDRCHRWCHDEALSFFTYHFACKRNRIMRSWFILILFLRTEQNKFSEVNRCTPASCCFCLLSSLYTLPFCPPLVTHPW